MKDYPISDELRKELRDKEPETKDMKLLECKESMTLTQCDKEKRYGRIILRWGDVKDVKFFVMSGLLNTFFPVDVHIMGEDAYCYMGMSPLFRSLGSDLKELDMKTVPFYQLIQEDNGDIRVEEMDIKASPIRKPTREEVRKLG